MSNDPAIYTRENNRKVEAVLSPSMTRSKEDIKRIRRDQEMRCFTNFDKQTALDWYFMRKAFVL